MGRARIAILHANAVELDFFLVTRTGYLHQTRLEHERDNSWQTITAATNPDMDRTIVELQQLPQEWVVGDWVRAVAYTAGDAVKYEPLNQRGPKTESDQPNIQ